jgi:glycosyltransferase involved in cell wall biosynthesis
LVVGRGELEVPLKAQAEKLGIERHVRFLGMRNDVPRLLAAMDVFVLPSLSEGLSIAALECMSAGKPIVASRVGGNPELIVEGETGLLVPPRDHGALAEALIKLLESKAVREKFGRRAALRAAQLFTAKRMADQYTHLYSELLQEC